MRAWLILVAIWLGLGSVTARAAPSLESGSLYLCLVGLVDLGLPPSDPFWTARPAAWTQKKIWSGADIPADHAYHEKK